MLLRLIKDIQFLAALLCALPVWYLLYVNELLTPSTIIRDGTLLSVLLLICLYPLLEELCFRGFIQTGMLKKPKLRTKMFGLSFANFLTSLLFAALHVFYQPLFLAILIFFPSLVFGHFRDRYHSIKPSFLLHAFYNSGWILVPMN